MTEQLKHSQQEIVPGNQIISPLATAVQTITPYYMALLNNLF